LRVAKGEIAEAVGTVGADQREIGPDGVFEQMHPPAEFTGLAPLGQDSADADGRVERRDAGAAGADALAERALRHALQLDPPLLQQPLERREVGVAATRGAAHHAPDLPGIDQLVRQRIAVRRRVHDQGEVARSRVAQRADQDVGKAGAAEPRDHDRRAVGDVGDGLGGRLHALVDRHAPSHCPSFECSIGS